MQYKLTEWQLPSCDCCGAEAEDYGLFDTADEAVAKAEELEGEPLTWKTDCASDLHGSTRVWWRTYGITEVK